MKSYKTQRQRKRGEEKMNYYCGNCGVEFRNILRADYTVCPFCKHKGLVQAIPNFETPEQYEARTGKPWPNDAPVWCLMDTVLINWHLTYFRETEDGRLYINGHYIGIKAVICAQGPEVPPDNWRPE